MTTEYKDLSFDEWVIYVFDHPVDDYRWYFLDDAPWWNEEADPALTVSYLTRLYTDILAQTAPYSDAQIDQGLWFLCSNACSNHMFPVIQAGVPLDARLACVRAMYTVFTDIYAVRCTPALGYLSEAGNPLNLSCYMWWDIFPYIGQQDDPARAAFDATVLDVMARTLLLDNDACRESALHGLGHWQRYYPQPVIPLIDAFLKAYPKAHPDDLRPELLQYAQQARVGCVL